LNIQAARERKVLRPSGADDLIPTDRLEFLASVTTTQYITLGRNRESGGVAPVRAGAPRGTDFDPAAANLPSDPGAGSTPPTSSTPAPAPGISEPPQQDKDGTWYFTCAKCGKRQRWTWAWKAPWPGAECWECWKEAKLARDRKKHFPIQFGSGCLVPVVPRVGENGAW